MYPALIFLIIAFYIILSTLLFTVSYKHFYIFYYLLSISMFLFLIINGLDRMTINEYSYISWIIMAMILIIVMYIVCYAFSSLF